MKPAPVDLPTIWRGCTYDDIILKWKDRNGDPIDLTNWTPIACTAQFDLHAVKTGPAGESKMSLTREQTSELKLGVYQWNWLWVNNDGSVPPPFLGGSVEVKNPVFNFT